MATKAPPVAADRGRLRPAVCLSHADGTCPEAWLRSMQECFAVEFDDVRLNDPFRGGHIIRSRPGGIPWLQLELSRQTPPDNGSKRQRVLRALTTWCERRVGEEERDGSGHT
jgi:hypothetical protein